MSYQPMKLVDHFSPISFQLKSSFFFFRYKKLCNFYLFFINQFVRKIRIELRICFETCSSLYNFRAGIFLNSYAYQFTCQNKRHVELSCYQPQLVCYQLSAILVMSAQGEKHGFTLWYLDTARQTFQTVEFLILFLN